MKRYLTIFMATIIVTSCQSDPAKKHYESIQNDIQNAKFEDAIQTIQNAKLKTSSEYTPILDYNKSVVQILAGQCETARQDIENQLKSIETQHAPQDKYKNSTLYYEQSKLQARLHHALALAILCPTQPYHIPGEQEYKTALTHLYQAASLGLEVRDTIARILTEWIKPCQEFIPEAFKNATSAENAIAVDPSREAEIILCNNGIWFKFQARKGEIIKTHFTLYPLDRKVWMDESSLLPFIQLNADMHIKPAPGESFETPDFHFEQPLPTTQPSPADYETIQLSTPEIYVKETGHYLIHFYTKNNGESRVNLKFEKSLDCGTVDDIVTYDQNLRQTPVELQNNQHVQHLMLCPKRPDAFQLALAPNQSALIAIHTNEPHITQPDFIQYRLETEKGKKLINLTPEPLPIDINTATAKDNDDILQGDEPPAALSDGQAIGYAPTPDAGLRPATPQPTQVQDLPKSPYYFLFTPKTQDKSNAQNMDTQAFILLHNPGNDTENIRLNLQIGNPQTPMPYSIALAVSHDCTENTTPPKYNLNLKNIEHTKAHFEPPIWVCHGTSLHLQPQLPDNTDVIRTKTQAHFLSTHPVRHSDVQFASYMYSETEDRDFLIENAQFDTVLWTPQNHINTQTLHKPISRDSHFHTTIHGPNSGFQIIQVVLNDDSSDDSSDSNKKNDPNKNEQKKDQKDNANKQNTPNKSPEKPSETPAAPKGPGTDTQGNESTPDENAKGNKASKLDLRQHEKDNIDALLDAMENGSFYVPLSGKEKPKQTDKPW